MIIGNAFYPNNVTPPNRGIPPEPNINVQTPKTLPNFNREYKIHKGTARQNVIFDSYIRNTLKYKGVHGGATTNSSNLYDKLLNEANVRIGHIDYNLTTPVFTELNIKGILDTTNLKNFSPKVKSFLNQQTNIEARKGDNFLLLKGNDYTVQIYKNRTVYIVAKNENVVDSQIKPLIQTIFGVNFIAERTVKVYRVCSDHKINIPVLKNCILPAVNSDENKRFIEVYGSRMNAIHRRFSFAKDKSKPGYFRFTYRDITYTAHSSGKIICANSSDKNTNLLTSIWEKLVDFCEKAGYHIMSGENANPAECGGETKTEVKTAQKKASRNKNLKPYTPGTQIGNKQYVIPALTPTRYAIKNVGKQNPQKKQILDRFKELAPGQFSNINKMIANFGLKSAQITKSDIEEYLKKNKAPEAPANKKPKTNPKVWRGPLPNINSDRWVTRDNTGRITSVWTPSNKGELKNYQFKPTQAKKASLIPDFQKYGKTPGGYVPKVLLNAFGLTQKRNQSVIETARKKESNTKAAEEAAARAKAEAQNKAKEEKRAKQEARQGKTSYQLTRERNARYKNKKRLLTQQEQLQVEQKLAKTANPVERGMTFGLGKGLQAAKEKLGIKKYSPTGPEKEALERLKKLREASRALAAAAKESAPPTFAVQRKSPVNTKPSRVQKSIMKTLRKKPKPFKGTIPYYKNQRIQKASSPTSAENLRKAEAKLIKEAHRKAREENREITRQVVKKEITAEQALDKKTELYKKSERTLTREINELHKKQRAAEIENAKARRNTNYRLQKARETEFQRIMSLPEGQRNKRGQSERNRAMTAFFNGLASNLPKTQPRTLENLYERTIQRIISKKSPSPNSNNNNRSAKKPRRNSPNKKN